MEVATQAPPKERPILFSAPMVRAILAGTKTQTRRIFKPEVHSTTTRIEFLGKHGWCVGDDLSSFAVSTDIKCPYGAPGDRLWVRETFWQEHDTDCLDYGVTIDCGPNLECKSLSVQYVASQNNPAVSEPGEWWTPPPDDWDGEATWDKGGTPEWHPWPLFTKYPSIHMPRWASRILLEVTAVRVERLNDINGLDAIAEGLVDLRIPEHRWHWDPTAAEGHFAPWRAYRALWESINGEGSWKANPWVWVVEFRRLIP